MEHFDASKSTYFKAWLGPRDTRVVGWFLLDNYLPTLISTIIYLLVVWLGPKYMKNRPPFSFPKILVVYNTALTLLSLYMFLELVTGVWESNYNFFCQGTRTAGESDMKIVNVLWWYYFSKLIEFMDTFFFILRKNNHQITVLHVYHHATMLNIWWFVMNWVPCGHSPVCADKHPDQLRDHLAVYIPCRMVVLPDCIHVFSDYALHKFLHPDLQQERGQPKERLPEGSSERLDGRREWRDQPAFPGTQCEVPETAQGLKTKS
ncbi:PREDICTED: elongation of very long chain fatty acids protein 5 isoform X2 [Elephantulus edwardii]|uniref:elongation of very long chain fatty acids protein 5 isoform X2 n=1 Tax=Elephantulus edwardii TaxID=28737 RepID=UPI0003F05C1B|nr:PREDICTED: elongation of very long chain fatty acids protein 5 isoform X2 [Elephantulus edwardii]